MLQAPMLDGLAFDLLPFDQDGLAAPEVDVGGGEVAEALVVAPMIVVGDEGWCPGAEMGVCGALRGTLLVTAKYAPVATCAW